MRENIIEIVNHTLASTWILIVIGLFFILIVERESVSAYMKKRKAKLLQPLFRRLAYMGAGLALIMGSFILVNTLVDIFVPPSFPDVDHSGVVPEGFWSTWRHYTDFVGLFTVIGYIIAGEVLVLSAGNRWMINLSKVIIVITTLFLFLSTFVAYA